jgi:hypothetical protein
MHIPNRLCNAAYYENNPSLKKHMSAVSSILMIFPELRRRMFDTAQISEKGTRRWKCDTSELVY